MSYTPQNALDLVQSLIHGIPMPTIGGNSQLGAATICDQIHSLIWTFFPWGWSIKSLTAINLTDGIQDYTPTDTDILRPLKLRLVRTDTTPKIIRDLSLLGNLPPDLERKLGIEQNTCVGWFSSQNFFRLMAAMSIGGTETDQLQGEYQKQPTKIDDTQLNTALPEPDYYFNVFVEGVLWMLYRLADDPRAGSGQITRNGSMISANTGQLAVFNNELLKMARTEDLNAGDEFRFPEAPLGTGHILYPGLFGI